MIVDGLRRTIRIRAHAKLNLTLRVLGTRPDGYHELRTVFQSLALHDTLTVVARPGPFEIGSDDPACPRDRTNLVWMAADRLWQRLDRAGPLSGVEIQITKRIPMQAGLGGGSSDAAAALIALAALWTRGPVDGGLASIGRELGADVPYFFEGGTAIGLERGDLIFPLPDCRRCWVVLVRPPFGISTRDAYGWWDEASASSRPPARPRPPAPVGLLPVPASEMVNDLEGPVVAHHPAIGRLVSKLRRSGASYAAMSGSGSAVFGLFVTEETAREAARLAGPGSRVVVTRTVRRGPYQRLAAPQL